MKKERREEVERVGLVAWLSAAVACVMSASHFSSAVSLSSTGDRIGSSLASRGRRTDQEEGEEANEQLAAFGRPDCTTISNNHCTTFGSLGKGPGQLNYPMGVAVDDRTGRLIVSEMYNHRMQVFDADGHHQRFIGDGQGSQDGQLENPWGLALNEQGRLFVADFNNQRVQIFGLEDGRLKGKIKLESNPQCVSIGANNELFVSLSSNQIAVVSADGQLTAHFGSEGSGDGQLNSPIGLAINSRGDLFVGDSANHRMSVFDRSFTFLTNFGQFNGGDLHVASDQFDRIVVCDGGSNSLQLFDADFELISQFGSEGRKLGQFNGPQGVSIDQKGTIIVCEGGNNRVQIVTRPIIQ